MMHSVTRPLPPIPITDSSPVPPTVRSNQMRVHCTGLPPPPKEPPPPPMSPPLIPITQHAPVHRIILPVSSMVTEDPRSPQPTRVTPRPRVPRMGTSVTPAQSPSSLHGTTPHTFGPKTDGGQMEFGRLTRLDPLRPLMPMNSREEQILTKLTVSHSVLATKPSPIQSLLSSARVTSNTVSSDLRRLFRRSTYLPNSMIDKRNGALNRGRLTPISERTNTSSPSTKQSYFSDYSLSDSELSDATETTNLSLTWPLSRSQTDLSSRLYRPYCKLVHTDQFATSIAPDHAIQNTYPPQMPACTKQAATPTVPLSTMTNGHNLPSTEVAELKKWMAEIDQDEITRRFKRMRMVTMTARKWTIKRRPDGTRYLAYRRSNSSRYRHHSNDPNQSSTNLQPDDSYYRNRSHKLAVECQDNRTSINKTNRESTPPELGRRKRHKSHRSGQYVGQPPTSSPIPDHRPESFPPSNTVQARSSHRSSPRDENQRRVSSGRPGISTETTSPTNATPAASSSRSTHRRGRHRARRQDGSQDIVRTVRNASCCLHRTADARVDGMTEDRNYVYYLANTNSTPRDRIRNINFSTFYPLSRSRADSADSDSTKLVTMLVV